MKKKEKKSFGKSLWEFFSGSTNKFPSSFDVASALVKGFLIREHVKGLFKAHDKFKKRRRTVVRLEHILSTSNKKSLKYIIAKIHFYLIYKI